MATVVKKMIAGSGPYLYRVEYQSPGNQKWEFLGRADAVGVDPGPIPNSTSKQDLLTNDDTDDTVNTENTTTDTDDTVNAENTPISEDEFQEAISGGWRELDTPDGVELNEWSRNRDRLYINGWTDGDDDAWINKATGEVNDAGDVTVSRRDEWTVTVNAPGRDPITLMVNGKQEWEKVEARDIEPGDTIRFKNTDDESENLPTNSTVFRSDPEYDDIDRHYPVEMRESRGAVVVDDVEMKDEESDNPFEVIADNFSHIHTDAGGLYTDPDEEVERVVGDADAPPTK